MAIALIVWLISAKATGGELTVETLSDQWVSFAGNAAAIVSGGVLSIGLSLWRPANFDWEKTRTMTTVKESILEETVSSQGLENEPASGDKGDEVGNLADELSSSPTGTNVSNLPFDELDLRGLERTYKFYSKIFTALALVITIVCANLLFVSSIVLTRFTAIRSYLYHWALYHMCSLKNSLLELSESIL